MDRADFLNALATVCESAQRMPVCSTATNPTDLLYEHVDSSALFASPQSTMVPDYEYPDETRTAATPTSYQPCSSATVVPETPLPAGRETDHHTPGLLPFPTPPQTPYSPHRRVATASAGYWTVADTDSQVLTAPLELVNPLLRNVIAYAQFVQFLDETWPEKCVRRGSAVIRASLYSEIADALRGGACTSRFRYWVKKSGFFLIERLQPDGSCGACLAVPVVQGDGEVQRQHYRLVARLEDFIFIIGLYHNDEKGHAGIRKTYSLIQEEFCYLPRTAVAKFIELCDTCSVRLTRLRAGKQAEQCRRGGTKRARSDSEVIPAVPVVGDHENECKRTRREECLFSTVQHPLLSSSLLLEGKELPEELKEVMAGLGWEELLSLYNESSTDSFQPSASSENRAS